MYRQDYILRLIEQFARALSGLLNKIVKRERPAHEIRAEIGAIATQSGLDLNVARALDPVMLLMWLAPRGEVDPGRFWLMAELLFLEGLQLRTEGAAGRGEPELERALVILLRLDPAWRPQPDLASAGERIAEIRGLLGDDPTD
jgi:hypothetical protein